MALPTIDEKIAWVLHQIQSFEQAIAESRDDEFIQACEHQLTFFYAILDDLYGIRLWNHVHKSEKFDLNVLPMMSN
jgi:hypothetical protein